MKTDFWITVNERGVPRLTRNAPGIRMHEVSLKIALDLPDALFTKPRLHAEIKVPSDAVNTQEIDVNVTESIAEAIKTATGLDMVVSVVKPEKEDAGKVIPFIYCPKCKKVASKCPSGHGRCRDCEWQIVGCNYKENCGTGYSK